MCRLYFGEIPGESPEEYRARIDRMCDRESILIAVLKQNQAERASSTLNTAHEKTPDQTDTAERGTHTPHVSIN